MIVWLYVSRCNRAFIVLYSPTATPKSPKQTDTYASFTHTHPQMHTHIPSTRAFTPHTPNALPKFTRFALSSRVAGATNSLVVIIAYSVQAVVVVALQRC